MYRIIQSFKPEEITPEEAHKIAYELAREVQKATIIKKYRHKKEFRAEHESELANA